VGRHRFARDRFCKQGLVVIPLLAAGSVAAVAVGGAEGGYYFAAVLGAIFAAVLVLMALSIPRHVRIDPAGIEIVCAAEVTIIPSAEIASVEWLDRLPRALALPGGCMIGFGGYCGYWLSTRTLRPFKIYATQRGGPALLVSRKSGCQIVIGGFEVK